MENAFIQSRLCEARSDPGQDEEKDNKTLNAAYHVQNLLKRQLMMALENFLGPGINQTVEKSFWGPTGSVNE
jgi:hypothetical protein